VAHNGLAGVVFTLDLPAAPAERPATVDALS
jgi:hypothetical protein